MYTLANIEKFVRENQQLLGSNAEDILQRAQVAAINEIIPRTSLLPIMASEQLAIDFHCAVMTDPGHTAVSMSTLVDYLSTRSF